MEGLSNCCPLCAQIIKSVLYLHIKGNLMSIECFNSYRYLDI